MAGIILGLMFFEKPLDQFGFIAPAKIPMGDVQNATRLNRRESDGVGEVGVTGNEEAPFGEGKDSFEAGYDLEADTSRTARGIRPRVRLPGKRRTQDKRECLFR